MKKTYYVLFILTLFTFLFSCQEAQEDLSTNAYTAEEYGLVSSQLDLPEELDSYGFGNAEIDQWTDYKGTLGRVLFYDKSLSSDGKVACASCHQQSLAFADDRAFSIGANGNRTGRNSLALGSLRSFGAHYSVSKGSDKAHGLFWDERAGSIKEQLQQTINNPNEMDMNLQQIADRVQGTDYYRVLHQKAFESEVVTEDHILEAIEVFINSINSPSSIFEREVFDQLNFINGDQVTGSTGHELGLQLFVDNCNSCHTTSLHHFLDVKNEDRITIANNGLELNLKDQGLFEYTGNTADIGKFKIPGLHNIELTAPYMHDGRFATLEEVVEHYNSGIVEHPNLHSNLMKGGEALRLNLSEEEKTALVEFLRLLTDRSITIEKKWSDPFL